MADPDAPMVTMRHTEHGGEADFPTAAVEMWRPLGWVPVAALETEPPADVPPKADQPDSRPAARKRTTDTQE